MTRRLVPPHAASLITVLVIGILFILAVLYQRPTLNAPLNIYDEGIITYGSVRVMEGQIPYRDFWTQYSPAQLYLLAGFFKAFGKQIMVERWWDVLTRAALALGLGALVAQFSSRKSASLIWALGLLWVTYYGFFGYPIFQGLLFSLLSIAALTRALGSALVGADAAATRRWLILSGVLLGVATLFRHDMAIYVGAAETLVIFGQSIARHRLGGLRVGLARWVSLAASATVVVLPVLIFLLINVPAYELLDQLFIFPLTIFPKVRDLPYPELEGRLEELPFYAPFLIYALAALIASAQIWRARRAERAENAASAGGETNGTGAAWGVLAVVLFGLFGWNQARVRSDTIHTVQFFLPALTLLPVLYRAGSRRANLAGFTCAALALTLSVALCIDPIAQYLEVRKRSDSLEVQRSVKLSLPVAQGTLMSADQIFAVQTVQGLTEPGEPVYVGLTNHSRIFANDVMFYFLMERPSPTRYHEIHPGLVNTVAVQREMIADLERKQVRYLVLTNMFEDAREPNDTAVDSKVTLLDDYIKAHYLQAHTLGSYRILKLRTKK